MYSFPQIDDFNKTVVGLEQGLLVRSIMFFPLATVGPDADPHLFFDENARAGFDCAPVRQGQHIIGMIYREDLGNAKSITTAQAAMRPLHQVPIIAATEPIISLIRKMQISNEHFWLVLDGTSIDAIVTRSDLWRLPVRLLTISRIIHLEQLLTAIIRLNCAADSWMADLTLDRQKKINSVIQSNRKNNEQLDALESTNFSDKLEILGTSLQRRDEKKELGGVIDLRNQLMHARDGEGG